MAVAQGPLGGGRGKNSGPPSTLMRAASHILMFDVVSKISFEKQNVEKERWVGRERKILGRVELLYMILNGEFMSLFIYPNP